MRLFLPLAACILLLVRIQANRYQVPANEYVPLILKVREFYHTSAIFIVHLTRGDKVFDEYILHTWTRMISRERISTLDVFFSRMYRTMWYVGNSVRPLFVVMIKDEDAFHQFSEATRTFKMSFAAWFLIFLQPPEEGERDHCHYPIGNPFNVAFNLEMLVLCPGDNMLREWYSIDGKNIEISELAIWKRNHTPPFALLTNLTLYERRRNLRGMVLHGVIIKDSPLFTIGTRKPGGMLGRIMVELMEALNFTLDYRESNLYGMRKKNGSWDGAIGEITAGSADIGLSTFSMTSNRMDAVDYLTPLLTSRNHIYFKQPDAMAVQWFAYFATFSFWVWSCVIAVILLTTILVSITYTYSGSTRTVELVSESFLTVWGIFCQQGLSEFPRSSSLRVVFFTTFIVAIVVSAAYSAALISFLTASPRTLPFRSFEEFIQDGRYRLIVVQSSAEHELFSVSKEELSRRAKLLMVPDHSLPKTMDEAFTQICKNPKLVFYYSEDRGGTLTYWSPCPVISIDAGRVDSMSIVVARDSQYTDIFNHNILKFMFNGMMTRMKGTKLKMQVDNSVRFDPVKMNNVAPILTIFSCGVGLGLVVLLIEKCYALMMGNRRRDTTRMN